NSGIQTVYSVTSAIFYIHYARGVRVGEYILLEPGVMAEDVIDQPAEEGDVAPRPDRNVEAGACGRAAEVGIHMDHGRAFLLRLHRPAEPNRVSFSHVAAHDQDGVGVGEVLLKRGGSASSEAGPQTGDGGAMSYAGLVLDRDNPQAAVEELLDQVVLFVVHGSAAEGGDRGGVIDQLAVGRALDEAGITGFFDALGDTIKAPLERTVFPVIRVRRAIAHGRHPVRIDDILIGGGAFRAERTLVDRRRGIALDVDDAPVLDVDQLATPDGAVRTDGGDHLV